MTDYRQAALIMRLVSITDRVMRKSDSELRTIIHQNREDLICSLPLRRVWLFVKIMRKWSSFRSIATIPRNLDTNQFEGIEDAFVDGQILAPLSELSQANLA